MMLPPFMAKLFPRRPAPKLTATQRCAELRGIPCATLQASIPRDKPETQRETWLNDNAPDQVERNGDGQ